MITSHTIHVFRYGGQGALTITALSGALLGFTILAALAGPGFDATSLDLFWLILAVLFLGALVVLPLWARATAPVLMRVGPDGLEMPVTWSAPLPWRDIHRIRAHKEKRRFTHAVVLRLDLLPGRVPPYRLAFHAGAERWLLRKTGVRLPISSFDAPPEAVVASIQRFFPVSGPG